MKLMPNEKGVTLIELLLTLTILSLLIGLVYGVFINGIHYSGEAKDTASIQQETNLMVTMLKEQHENQNWYRIEISSDHKKVSITNSDKESFVLEQDGLIYYINNCDNSLCEEQSIYKIYPMKEVVEDNSDNAFIIAGDFHIKILIKNEKNSNLNFQVKTILSRL